MLELCEAIVSRDSRVKPLGFTPGDHYRFVPQGRIINMLRLYGFADDIEFSDPQEYLTEKLESWVSRGLSFRVGPKGERLFDPAEVYNYFKLAGVRGEDDFLSAHVVTNHRRMVERMAAHAIDGECRLALEFRRTFPLEGVAPGTKLRLRASAPLGGKYIKALETKLWTEDSREMNASRTTQSLPGLGRLETRLTTAGEPFATIEARFDFTVVEQTGDKSGDVDRQLYLKDEEGLISVTPKIREMARALAKPGAPPLEAIHAFWEHLNGEMIFGAIHYDQVDMKRPSEWVVEHGWYDCQMGAALLASLCRASGIPTRLVCGYLIYHHAPVRHYWMEAWLEDRGWAPFDFMSWDLSDGGRDIGWRDRFFGKVDYRLMLERMPREFTGAIGVSLPPAWVLLPQLENGGVASHFNSIDGRLIYSDFLRITS